MKKIILSFMVVLLMSGCSMLDQNIKLKEAIADSHDPKVVKAYENKITKVLKELQNDPSYVRIPINTKVESDWFITQLFLYYDNKISKEEFLNRGEKKYPGYRKSFAYIADRIK